MIGWIKQKCFTDLMLDKQRNNLFFLIVLIVYAYGEFNILQNMPFSAPPNQIFLGSSIVLLLAGLIMLFVPALEHVYKYVMMTLLLASAFTQVYLFSVAHPVFQVVYFYMAVGLIYMNGRLVVFNGLVSFLFTYLGFTMYHDLFFPTTPVEMKNMPLGLIVQTTIAMWAVTRIGHYLLQTVQKEKEEANNKALELQRTHALIESTVQRLQENFKTLKNNVQVSSQSSEEIKVAFSEIATGAQVQAENISSSAYQLNEMESLTDELLEQVKSVAVNVVESLSLSNVSKQKLQNFEERMRILEQVVNETGAVIRDLTEQSNQINDIVKLITGISNQTSLLALNANIEAARAGEHGRGFTVVANEVLKLADESQKSAERIQAILKRFKEKADIVEEQIRKGEKVQIESNQMLNEVLVNVDNLASFITSLDTLMGNIVSHQQRFKDKTSRIVQEVTHASSVTEQTSAATEQVLASVEEEAQRIRESVRALENVDNFVNDLQGIVSRNDEKKYE
jgi:methyl-accepting chemotaxis protein